MNRIDMVLVDYENIQKFELDALPPEAQVYIFVGAGQKKIPLDLVKAVQARGPSVRWVEMAGQGRNALDFHLAFYLGELNQTMPKTASFTILSADKGYDSVIKHLATLGRTCRRVVELSAPARPEARKGPSSNLKRVLANLEKIDVARRPRTRAALTKHVGNLLPKGTDAGQVSAVVAELLSSGRIAERGNRVTYSA